jgi:uncharacterized membrane protein YbhN (UPF0104 family)
MLRTVLHMVAPLLGVVLFALAVWALYHQLKSHSIADMIGAFDKLPPHRIALAVLFTVLGYAILTGYDYLAMKYVHHRVSYRRIAMAAFIGYAFSNSIGHSFLTGGGVRYRLYSLWGLTGMDVVKVIVFAHVTFYTGMFVLIGTSCLMEPRPIANEVHLSEPIVMGIGAAMLAVVFAYLIWTKIRAAPVRFRQVEFPLPRLSFSAAQLTVASLDMALMAAVLWVLLPPPLSEHPMTFAGFLGIFMVAQVIGVGSQVPGGLGVFEMLMIHVLGDGDSAAAEAAEPQVLAALLIYRLIYFVIPLALGAAWLGFHELRLRHSGASGGTHSRRPGGHNIDV